MPGGRPKDVETRATQMQIAEWVGKGKSRSWIMEKLQEDGMSYPSANKIYYNALKDLAPDPDLISEYKKSLIQQNLDRLEKIVESSISGNTAEKMVALKAIDQLNKLAGAYNDNQITVARNKEGDEIIQIKFGE